MGLGTATGRGSFEMSGVLVTLVHVTDVGEMSTFVRDHPVGASQEKLVGRDVRAADGDADHRNFRSSKKSLLDIKMSVPRGKQGFQ